MKDKKIEKYLEKADRFSGDGELYQSVTGVEGKGTRNLKDRWKLYKILSADLKGKKVVDIGCNIGGFSKFCKDKVKSYLGIEPFKESTKLAKHLFPYSNCTFRTSTFDKLKGKFDVILALAVRRYTGLSMEAFAEACSNRLNENGLIFFESHGREKLTPKKKKAFEKYFRIERVIDVPSTSLPDCENVRFFIRGIKK
ncbi:MAG: class I SAM-dependent methyltransferase [Candidatus Heimdallarchaeaceae archaeon]